MFDLSKSKNKTKIIAFVSVFTAIYTVLRLIPTVPMIGVSGATFSLSDVIAPLYGLILGPYIGGLCILLGTLVTFLLGKPVIFMGLDFLPAMINAVALGLLIQRRWKPVAMLNFALLLMFFLNPLTSFFVELPIGSVPLLFPFAWLHLIAFIVLLSPQGRKAIQRVKLDTTGNLVTGLTILVFVGTMLQHLMGTLLFELILGPPIGLIPVEAYPGIWSIVFFFYPLERFIVVFLSVTLGTPLIKILRTFLAR